MTQVPTARNLGEGSQVHRPVPAHDSCSGWHSPRHARSPRHKQQARKKPVFHSLIQQSPINSARLGSATAGSIWVMLMLALPVCSALLTPVFPDDTVERKSQRFCLAEKVVSYPLCGAVSSQDLLSSGVSMEPALRSPELGGRREPLPRTLVQGLRNSHSRCAFLFKNKLSFSVTKHRLYQNTQEPHMELRDCV